MLGTEALPVHAPATDVPRAHALGDAWAALGPEAAVLANASGHPLARTIKLILDPLVIRPQQRPHLASGSLSAPAAAELRTLISDARSELVATASWYRELKRARRRARITDGNPQDLYFQRCFELARTHGAPTSLGTAERAVIADEIVIGLTRSVDDLTSERLLAYVHDPGHAARLTAELEAVWRGARRSHGARPLPDPSRVHEALSGSPDAFDELVAAEAGSARGEDLFAPRVAAEIGLTVQETPSVPAVGDTASKQHLPRPFDRSLVERLFAALPALVEVASADDLPQVFSDEMLRSAGGWQLAEERSRVTMTLGAEASSALEGASTVPAASPASARSPMHARLRERWDREAYVRRAKRLPDTVAPGTLDDVADIRGAYVRRLWVRLHGRELRERPVAADELERTLDGVLRSVVLDQRHRLKRAIERDLRGPT